MRLDPPRERVELDPEAYARGHRHFEQRSDQRALIIAWLQQRLGARSGAPALSVLSVGCGDGSVDAPLAAALPGRRGAGRDWTGVDPHGPSVAGFLSRFEALPAPAPGVRGHVCRFADLPVGPSYDVVTFVHSLYYVDDLDATLTDALGRLAPGGELLVLHAPLGTLNQLTADFAPPVAGHPQPWSHEVEESLARIPVDVGRTELSATVDLTGIGDAHPALLEFVVQASLDTAGRSAALAGLAAIATPGRGLRVPHPVTAYCITHR